MFYICMSAFSVFVQLCDTMQEPRVSFYNCKNAHRGLGFTATLPCTAA